MNIYVGNLSFDTTERDLEAAFASFGHVKSARLVTDRETDRPRGFGFVEMENTTEGQSAIAGLNGRDLQGRTLAVNEARPREERSNRGSNNRGGYAGGNVRF